ncbi:MAG: undecaprenyl-diphosphate phosphatase [Actinomycetota bacterium]|nr:undecaprenyl-diphosphate phosphatase [Actinomycetota bacterium]
MPLLHALILGITQGLSEFLPISSSGHLQLVPWLFGWDDFAGRPQFELTFSVSLHIGTLAGALAYFRRDLLRLARAALVALRLSRTPAMAGGANGPAGDVGVLDEGRTAWLLLASAVPAAITGVLLNDSVGELGNREWLIGILLVVFGLVLLWADRMGGDRGFADFRVRDAALMGAAQALALAPGVSRSGVTITASRKLGFSRDAAARLSFLMSLPIIGGAVLFEGVELFRGGGIPPGFTGAFLVGIASAGVTGWLAVWGTLRLLRTRTFRPFVAYRVVVGTAVMTLAVTSLR